jgi:hypothetical protein
MTLSNPKITPEIGAGGNVPVGGLTREAITPKPDALNPFIARDLSFVNDWHSMLIYGDYGVGKTYLAGTSALVDEYSDVLYIALEGGERGLKQLLRVDAKVADRITVIPVQSFKQYGNIYEFLKMHVKFRDSNDVKHLRALEAQIKGYSKEDCLNDELMEKEIPNPKRFKTVITDSLTEAQKYCMYQLLGINPEKQRIDDEPDRPQFAEWGSSREMVCFLIRRFRDLPINNVFICGQDTDQDAGKKWYFEPLLPGKLSNDVRGLVSTVGYLTTVPHEDGSLERRLYLVGGTYGNSNIAAKHRFGSVLKTQYLLNPTMQDIYNLDHE